MFISIAFNNQVIYVPRVEWGTGELKLGKKSRILEMETGRLWEQKCANRRENWERADKEIKRIFGEDSASEKKSEVLCICVNFPFKEMCKCVNGWFWTFKTIYRVVLNMKDQFLLFFQTPLTGDVIYWEKDIWNCNHIEK